MALKSNGLKNSRRWLKRNNRGVSWWIFCQAFNFSYLSTTRPVKSNCHWPEHVTRKGYQVMLSDVLVNNLFLSNIVLTICLFIGDSWFWKSEQPTDLVRLRAIHDFQYQYQFRFLATVCLSLFSSKQHITGAPDENLVQNHLNIALLNVS